MRSKKPRRPVPPTLLHRTLIFPLGRAASPGGLSERARVSQPFCRLWRVSGPPWTTPRRPAGEHHEHSGARNRLCGARRGIASFLSKLRKPPKGAHHQHQRGPAEGGCVLGSHQKARGLAPGFYLRCPPVGAAPRIQLPSLL